jgi:hypothetical protein
MVIAPWNDDQVASLTAYQACGFFHEFTCGRSDCRKPLTATPAGWVCECGYRQNWAHGFMTDWSWNAARGSSTNRKDES